MRKNYQIVSKKPDNVAEDAYSCLIMSQDHKYGLSAGPGRKDQVIVWDVKKLSQICKLRGFKHSRNGINDVYRMCISADNRYVAATSYMQILIWDLQSRRIVKTITEEGWKTMTVFSNDNRLFAYCPTTYAKRFHVIDVPCDGNRSGSGTDIVFNCMGECKALAFSRDGKRIWSLDNSDQNGLKLWDLSSPEEPLMMATASSSHFNRLKLVENDTILYVVTGKNNYGEDVNCFHVDYEFEVGGNGST